MPSRIPANLSHTLVSSALLAPSVEPFPGCSSDTLHMSLLAKPAPLSRSSSWLPAPARPRGVLGTALALLLLSFTLLAAVRCGGKALRHAVRALYYTTDPLFLGR